jgi:PmbA protein
MPLLVEARCAESLLRHLTKPLSGSFVQQKESFFEGKLAQPVASRLFTLTDEPLLRRGLGSAAFDEEGIAARSRTLIGAGVLQSYLLDVYYAHKLGMRPSTGKPSNLVVRPGARSLAQLQRDLGDGIVVTGFLGGNSNTTSGAFSLGISGFQVVRGERQRPISEMNISGTQLEFWRRLVAVGNDSFLYTPTRSPSLLFDAVSVAGA